MEAFPCGQPVLVPAGVPSVHGLHDLPVFPHGFLAADHYLQQHPHLAPGKGQCSPDSPRIFSLERCRVDSV